MKDKLPELRGSRGQKDRAIIHQKKIPFIRGELICKIERFSFSRKSI